MSQIEQQSVALQAGVAEVGGTALDDAVAKAQRALLARQHHDGYWSGELEADVSVPAGYLPLMHFMGREVSPQRVRRMVHYVMSKELPQGGWGLFHGGPPGLNVTIQTYLSLKMAGIPADSDAMRKARQFVLDKGGISNAYTFTKIWLAIFGQYDWRGVPRLSPEIIYFPNWSYFNIYEFASWSRATIVALMAVLARKPVCRLPGGVDISELYCEPEGPARYAMPGLKSPAVSWHNFFVAADRMLRVAEAMPLKPGRAQALRRVQDWILEHQEADGSWGGIMLPWVYSLVALKLLGLPDDHPALARSMAGLESFILEDGGAFRLQPAVSPVWDTALAVIALADSGLEPSHPALLDAGHWLLSKEIRRGGDWQVKNPHAEPGGWPFEFFNDQYPDIDDTAAVGVALMRVGLDGEDKDEAIRRGLRWAVSMQSKDGGWAAFDKDNDKQMLAHIPFADFMTPLDPTTPDVTAHVVELLGRQGYDSSHPALGRGLRYLEREQKPSGPWYGRWGVNYIYGSAAVLMSLAEVKGGGLGQSAKGKAAQWLKAHQNADGGWGESCLSYEDESYWGKGPSTASQTAWALLGLLAAGEGCCTEAQRGVSYLVSTQRADGTWAEEDYTGTGFPRAFYLRYHLYRNYFPLMALSRYRAYRKQEREAGQ